MPNRAAAGLSEVDPYAAQLVSRMTVKPAYARLRQISKLVTDLRAIEVWDGLDGLYLFAAHDAQAARLNWRKPAHDLAAVGTLTFTADRGYQGDGATGYLDPTYAPNLHGVGWQLNSASQSFWSRSASQNGQRMAGQSFRATMFFNAGNLVSSINNTGSFNAAVIDTVGLFTASRTASNLTTAYNDGASVGTVATVADQVPDNGMSVVGQMQGAGGVTQFWNGQAALWAFGAGRSAAKEAGFYAAVLEYLQAVGAA